MVHDIKGSEEGHLAAPQLAAPYNASVVLSCLLSGPLLSIAAKPQSPPRAT